MNQTADITKRIFRFSQEKLFRIFLLVYAVIGFITLRDYGVPLDELTQRNIGIINNNYILGHSDTKSLDANGYFGPIFESVSYLLEQTIYTQPIGTKIMLRHALLFLIFLLSLRSLFAISKKMYPGSMAPLAGVFLLASYPWLFAHAHYNSKDTFFLCLIIFSFYYFQKWLIERKLFHLLAAALILGMAATVRLHAALIMTCLMLCILFMANLSGTVKIKLALLSGLVFIFSFYILFPYLWAHPLDHFQALFSYVSHNPWPWNTRLSGQEIAPNALPWWYLPGWISVTVPALFLMLIIAGFILYLSQLRSKINTFQLFILLSFLFPFLFVMLFKPTIYNGWRHMQFLLVPLSLFATLALHRLLKLRFGPIMVSAICIYSAAISVYWHPFGHSYFNEVYQLTAKSGDYDSDYWGLSSLQGLRWIAANDKSDSIVVSSFTEAPELNIHLLPEKDRQRFRFIRTPGAGKYELELRRGGQFGTLPGKTVHSFGKGIDTFCRIVLLRRN